MIVVGCYRLCGKKQMHNLFDYFRQTSAFMTNLKVFLGDTSVKVVKLVKLTLHALAPKIWPSSSTKATGNN